MKKLENKLSRILWKHTHLITKKISDAFKHGSSIIAVGIADPHNAIMELMKEAQNIERKMVIKELDNYIRGYSTPREILDGNAGVAVEKTFAHILDKLSELRSYEK